MSGASPATAPARPGTASPATAPVMLPPRRRPGYLGPVHVLQLLVAEAALVALVAMLARGPAVLAATAGGSGAILVLVLGRRHRRWWLEHLQMRREYRRRVRPLTSGDGDGDPRLAALRRLAPGLVVENVRGAGGAQVGVAHDRAGWYAVVAVEPTTPMRDDPSGRIPLDVLLTALTDTAQPGVMLQVVTHTVPTPSLDAHPAAPAGRSYRDLLAVAGPVPTDRATAIAVRLDTRSLAAAGVGGDTAPGTVAALARRVAKTLRRSGTPHRLLDAGGLLDVLARSCDLEPWPGPGPAPAPREAWSAWHSHRLVHHTFWVRRWPANGRAAELVDLLGSGPASLASVALILAPQPATGDPADGPGGGATTDLRCLVRLAAPADLLPAACEAARRRAAELGAELFSLDGEQAPAVYASAPTGGGPR
jgi:type VII secretion protein EccE